MWKFHSLVIFSFAIIFDYQFLEFMLSLKVPRQCLLKIWCRLRVFHECSFKFHLIHCKKVILRIANYRVLTWNIFIIENYYLSSCYLGRFLPLKTMLGPRYDSQVAEENRFHPSMLSNYLKSLKVRNKTFLMLI